MTRETKFLFDHLPKTGGTAFRTALERIVGHRNVTPTIEGRSEVWAVQRFAGARLISGHFLSLVPGRDRWSGRVRLTLFRHPIDRAISEYYYWRHYTGDGGVVDKLGKWAQQYDIADFFRARAESREAGATNLCTTHFASRMSRNLGDRSETLALAMRCLTSYDFIGIYEHLHDSLDLFCLQFRLPTVDEIPRVNVTPSRVRVSDLDRRALDQLVAMNDLDLQLYDSALQMFEARKRKILREAMAGRNGKRLTEPSGTCERALPAASIEDEAGKALPARVLRKGESFGTKEVEVVAAQVIGEDSGSHEVAPGEVVTLCISITANAEIENLTVGFDVSDPFGEVVFGTNTWLRGATRSVRAGRDYDIVFRFKANLNRGRYSVAATLHTGANHTERCFHWLDHAAEFDVVQLGEPDFIGYCRLEPSIEWWGLAPSVEPAQTPRILPDTAVR